MALRLLLKLQPNLRSLSFANCPKVHGADFSPLDIKRSRPTCYLSQIDMQGCAALHDGSIVALLSCSRTTLETLGLGALQHITSSTFQAIAQCSNLRVLDLSMCRSLTNGDLAALSIGCQELRSLQLQGCVNIGDAGLAALAQHSAKLERLSLEFCFNVTDAGFSAVVSHCQELKYLNVKACNQLTVVAFQNLVRYKKLTHPLKTLELGACAGQLTTTAYATIVKQKFPRCVVYTA